MAIAFVITAAAAGLVAVAWGASLGRSPGAVVVLAVVSGLLLAPWLRGLVRELVVRLAGAPRAWLWRASLGCALVGTWAAVTSFARPSEDLDVTIEATGRRHPDARGTDVWVRIEVDGVNVRPSDMDLGSGWVGRDFFAVWGAPAEPSSLRWQGAAGQSARLVFVSHEWSGQVRVRHGGRTEEFDLYANPATEGRVVELTAPLDRARAQSRPRSLLGWLVDLTESLLLAAVLLGALAWLTRPPSGQAARAPPRGGWEVLQLASPLALTSVWSLALFWPGLMTADSLDQWSQAATLELNDAHPLLYGLLMAALRRAWDSPAPVAIFQALAMSLAAGLLVAVAGRALRAPWRARGVAAFAVALHPMVALTTVTLWKDTLFTAATVALVAWVAWRAVGRSAPRRAWLEPLLVGGVAFVAWAMRHNGLPVALASVAAVALAAREARRSALAAFVVAATLYAAFTWVTGWVLAPPRSDASWTLPAHHIAAHLKEGHLPASEEDRQLLRDVLDSPDWNYWCATSMPTMFAPNVNAPLARERRGDLVRIWRELASAWPGTEVKHQLCSSALVWRLDDDEPALYLNTVALGVVDERVAWINGPSHLSKPAQASLFPAAAERLGRAFMERGPWWLWRPASFLVLLVLSTIVARLRTGDQRVLALLLVPLAHSVVLAMLTPAQDARYQLPIYVLALALLPVMLCARASSLDARSSEATRD